MAKETGTGEAGDELGTLRQDIERLRNDLAALTKHMKGAGAAAMANARSSSAAKLDDLQDEVERTVEHWRRQGELSVSKVEQTIQDKPLLSLLAAFGIGMLVTRLLERR